MRRNDESIVFCTHAIGPSQHSSESPLYAATPTSKKYPRLRFARILNDACSKLEKIENRLVLKSNV